MAYVSGALQSNRLFRRSESLPKRSRSCERRTWLHPVCVLALVAFTEIENVGALEPTTSQAQVVLPPRPLPVPTLSSKPGLMALESSTGARWQVLQDPWSGVARQGWGGRGQTGSQISRDAALQTAEEFVHQHAALLGAGGVDLQPVRLRHSGRAWHVSWGQRHAGQRVLGCFLDLTLGEDGDVVAFRSTLVPGLQPVTTAIDVATAAQRCAEILGSHAAVLAAEAVVLVLPEDGSDRATGGQRLHLGLPSGARWLGVVEAESGQVVQLESLVRTDALAGQVTGMLVPKYYQDRPVVLALPWLRLQLGPEETDPFTYADGAGHFLLETPAGGVTLHASLTGLYANVSNAANDPQPHFEKSFSVPGQAGVFFGAAEARLDERTIYYHTNVIHDFFKEKFAFDLLDFPVVGIAEAADPWTGDPNFPNAYWNGEQMGFGNGGRRFYNLGYYSDVIYHEYAHATTDYIYRPVDGLTGPLGGAMHEAFSDYFASTINAEPYIGEKLYRGIEPYMRLLDNQLMWPDDRDGMDEVHANGEILGGALWDLRKIAGAEIADAVIHHARELHPRDFEELLTAILLQDDLLHGDGMHGNGSPNREAVLTAFGLHGIGPLGAREMEILHTPLGDIETETSARKVEVHLSSFHPGSQDFVRLHYSTGDGYTETWLQRLQDGSFVGFIPAMPLGTRVDYYLGAARFPPYVVALLPTDAPAHTFSYEVRADVVPPRIEHSPVTLVAAFEWPVTLHATLTDNVGVASAYVEYRLNGEPMPRLVLVPSSTQPNAFATEFPNTGVSIGDRIDYAITVVDASRSSLRSRFPSQGTIRLEIVRELQEFFESTQAGWTHEAVVLAQPDPWHRTPSHNHTPGGTQAWLCSDSATGSYPAGVAAALVTAWYRVGNGASASIWSWMDADAEGDLARDGGIIELQIAGSEVWEALEPMDGYTHRIADEIQSNVLLPGTACLSDRLRDWRRLDFDLAAHAGQRLRLRFLFGSDTTRTELQLQGWALDDFRLDPGSLAATDVEPDPRTAPRLLLQQPPTPNPFNPRVTFQLEAPALLGKVVLELLDGRGRLVRRLLDGDLAEGSHHLVWDGRDRSGLASSSGVYYYRLHSRLGRETGKIVLIR